MNNSFFYKHMLYHAVLSIFNNLSIFIKNLAMYGKLMASSMDAYWYSSYSSANNGQLKKQCWIDWIHVSYEQIRWSLGIGLHNRPVSIFKLCEPHLYLVIKDSFKFQNVYELVRG